MPRKGLADHVYDVMKDQGWIEASLIRDRLYDIMRGGTPSVRELNSFLKRDKKIIGMQAPAGKTQIKKYSLKKN